MKVYGLIFTLWPVICLDPSRKEAICYKFLLEKDFFESRFNHWSAALRSFFMRLICWRVGRCSEDATPCDLAIMNCLEERLLGVYGYYLWACQEGKNPNTTPSNAVPGRRLVIIRADETRSTRTGPLVTYDSPVTMQNAAYKRSLLLDQICSPEPFPRPRPATAISFATSSSDGDAPDDSPKRWTGGLLRTIIGSSRAQSRSRSPSRRSSLSRPSTAVPNTAPSNDLPSHSSYLSFGTYYFRFALDGQARTPTRNAGPVAVFPPRPKPMVLEMPRIPFPAETLLRAYQHGRRSDSDDESAPLVERLPVGSPRARPTEPSAEKQAQARVWGKALAEWKLLTNEVVLFYERRKVEGVPGNRYVETPLLHIDVFNKPPPEMGRR
ncbi:hypothetical protein BT63DRAFT_430587 [Microthyrium microscopicum]|uniref:Uncharacterized protein n=1 Tax=Microthyrium microscopicum TaxID=703497 RepID=A0A6A6TTJ9_9PEZI|nr:hypothetical protein BT63DRAFT_430587 [Microthyrium microscopicum]